MNLVRRISLLLIIILSVPAIYGQVIDSTQEKIAKKFLTHLLKGKTDSCWLLFDQTNNAGVTREEFENAIIGMKNDLSTFDSFSLHMNGIKFAGDKQINLYSYKAIASKRNVVDEVSVDILFITSSHYLLGIQPKKKLKENSASTSKGKETPIEQGFTATIENETYKIKGINIVHFANNEGILAIQVEYTLPENNDERRSFAQKEAVKFAKYLVKNGYWEKAKQKAREIGRNLLDDIGVSFLDPAKSGGFNALVKAEEYK